MESSALLHYSFQDGRPATLLFSLSTEVTRPDFYIYHVTQTAGFVSAIKVNEPNNNEIHKQQ